MNRQSIFCFAIAALLMLGASPTLALGSNGATPQSQGTVGAKTSAEVKQVDINSASSKELKTLPGVTAAEAAKIIAGRPYGSKAQLVSRGVIGEATYQGLRQQIVARQPYKDSARNAALQAQKK